MAKALRLLTWNLQQLPSLARNLGNAPNAALAGLADPAPKARARAVARAILDMPPREQPDVVAFNEAFGEEGRGWLIRLLKPKFPFFIDKLEASGPGVEEDSGLMLFSKLHLLVFTPSGDTVRYERFPAAAGTDAKISNCTSRP